VYRTSSIVINPCAFAPVTSAEDANAFIPIGEPDGHHATTGQTQTEQAVFVQAVIEIGEDQPIWIGEGVPGLLKANAMFGLGGSSSHPTRRG
jgi:hypothetical protein